MQQGTLLQQFTTSGLSYLSNYYSSLVNSYQWVGGTLCLHLQGQAVLEEELLQVSISCLVTSNLTVLYSYILQTSNDTSKIITSWTINLKSSLSINLLWLYIWAFGLLTDYNCHNGFYLNHSNGVRLPCMKEFVFGASWAWFFKIYKIIFMEFSFQEVNLLICYLFRQCTILEELVEWIHVHCDVHDIQNSPNCKYSSLGKESVTFITLGMLLFDKITDGKQDANG